MVDDDDDDDFERETDESDEVLEVSLAMLDDELDEMVEYGEDDEIDENDSDILVDDYTRIDEIDECDEIDEMYIARQREYDEIELFVDESDDVQCRLETDDRDDVHWLIIIDYWFMQDVSTTTSFVQNDEIDENDDVHLLTLQANDEIDDVDEIDDKWLYDIHTQIDCDVLMSVSDCDERDDVLNVEVLLVVELREQIEQIDELLFNSYTIMTKQSRMWTLKCNDLTLQSAEQTRSSLRQVSDNGEAHRLDIQQNHIQQHQANERFLWQKQQEINIRFRLMLLHLLDDTHIISQSLRWIRIQLWLTKLDEVNIFHCQSSSCLFDDDELDEEVEWELDDDDERDELFVVIHTLYVNDKNSTLWFELDEYDWIRVLYRVAQSDEIVVSQILLHTVDDDDDEWVLRHLDVLVEVVEVVDDDQVAREQLEVDVFDNETLDDVDVCLDDDDDDIRQFEAQRLDVMHLENDEIDVRYGDCMFQLVDDDDDVLNQLDELADDEIDEHTDVSDVQQQHTEVDDDDDDTLDVARYVVLDETDVNESSLQDIQQVVDIVLSDERKHLKIDIACIVSQQIEHWAFDNKKLTACKEQSFSILFWAFNICEYNTIALYTISLIWAKRNKRNTKLSRLRRLYVSELIDDFDVWLLWREQSQNSQREEKSKWLQADHLLFGEIHTSKAFIESMTVICSEMW